MFARHWQTGEAVPDALFQKMKRARTFRAATGQMRQLGFGFVDLLLHVRYRPERDGDVVSYTRRTLQEFSPAKLPADITDKLNAAIVAALKDPRMRTQLENEGATPAPSSAADFAAFVRDDVQRWAPIVKQSGARPD